MRMQSQPNMTLPVADETPPGPLMLFILATLSSMMAPALADQQLARLAAREAIDAYQTRGRRDVLTIGQIIAFAVAALDSLRLSMPAEISLSMKLRLRGNANGLNRSSCQCTRLLESARTCEGMDVPAARPDPDRTDATTPGDAESVESVADRPAVETDKPEARTLTGTDWAVAMKSLAAKLQADAASGSPARPEIDALWIEALKNVGTELQARPSTALAKTAAHPSRRSTSVMVRLVRGTRDSTVPR